LTIETDETDRAMTEIEGTDHAMTGTVETDIAMIRTMTCSIHDEIRGATHATMTETDGIATMTTDIAIALGAAEGLWANLASPNGSARP
jgi:hypothetical protein|tara:strand:+ start:15259 stop:15525 length:267 start_codon:yes stop_codon:yes gene_type:complete